MKSQYSRVASSYQKIAESHPLRIYSFIPSFRRMVGSVKRKRVLDLGCGSGLFTRLIAKWGAFRIVGIDNSEKMLNLAREVETQSLKKIDYLLGDMFSPTKLGVFDLVISTLALHYAKDEGELKKGFTNAFLNLGSQGVFAGLINNPNHPVHPSKFKKYGLKIRSIGELKNGSLIEISYLGKEGGLCIIKHPYWTKESYERALYSAGFNSVEWIDLNVSEEGVKILGESFWRDYLNTPSVIGFKAYKQERPNEI